MTQTKRSVAEATTELEAILNQSQASCIVAKIDHQANAASVDQYLRPTTVVLFGNPTLGTPLMQSNPLTGLDLPQRIVIYENEHGDTHIDFRKSDYLRARYSLNGVDDQLETMSNAMSSLARKSIGTEIAISSGAIPDAEEGIVKIKSNNSFSSTCDKLISSIEHAEQLKLITTLDHSTNAERAGMSLAPSRVVVFGNPSVGTKLMQSSQSIGLDLPLSMLIYQDHNNDVVIAFNDPVFMAERYGITDQNEVISSMSNGLETLARSAT